MDQRYSPTRLLEIDAGRICVIKPSALGDVVQSLPLLPILRKRFPNARISWVISRALAPLLEGHPDLDELIIFERRGTWKDWRRLLTQLRNSEFDLVFDLQGLFRTGIMMLATRARLRVGLETAREGAQWGWHFAVPETGLDVAPHVRYRHVAEALGLADLPLEAHLPVSVEDTEWAQCELGRLKGPALAIHPGARWQTKRWPPERFAAVACKAIRRYGLSPVLLGTSEEEPVALQVAQTIRGLLPTVELANLAGRTTLKQLAAVLKQSQVLLTNDSGPMQMAAALGTPVVAVFTCTSPVISGPPGPQHELVATGVSCAASYRKKCPYRGRKHLACMEELDVERVWSGFGRLMQKNFPQTEAA
jgi:lipopolysaccharide heptosyltransferase II